MEKNFKQMWNSVKHSRYMLKQADLNDDLVALGVLIITCCFVFFVYKVLKLLQPVKRIKRLSLDVINKVFSINSKMTKGLQEIRKEVHRAKKTDIEPYTSLPHLSDKEIIDRLEKVKQVDRKREAKGKQGGNYYFSNTEDNRAFVSRLASDFMYTNQMHFDSNPGSQLIENELIKFLLELTNAPQGAVGTCTTGGTESILLSMLAYRELGLKKGISHPEIIMPESAHVAFLKAAFLFCIKVSTVPVSEDTGEVSVNSLLKAINKNTVAIVCTAGTYAHGVMDPIEELNKKLKGTDLWIHVDACLGGYMASCSALKGDGRLPIVDFRLDRVGTISIDPHKYGESPKGCSLILFRNEELKKCSLFYYMRWNGGIYATPSLPGSRSSANFIGAWISMVRYGKEGLLDNYEKITSTLDTVVNILNELPEFKIIGNPKCCVLSFTTTKASNLSIFDIQEALKQDGWDLHVSQKPYAIHVSITKNNMEHLKGQFKKSLQNALAYAKSKPNCGKDSMFNVFYGSLLKLPDEDMIEQAIKTLMVEVNRLQPND